MAEKAFAEEQFANVRAAHDLDLVLTPNPGIGASSAALQELVRPILEGIPPNAPIEVFNRLARLGLLAWNLADSSAEGNSDIEQFLKSLAPADAQTISTLRNRKLELFPNDKRIFFSAEVTRLPSGVLSLYAIATLPPTPSA